MAKGGLKKKFIQMAKRGRGTAKTLFKRAWALQKRGAKGLSRKKTASKPTTKKRGTTMAKKKTTGKNVVIRYRNRAAAKAAPKKRYKVSFLRNKVVNATVNGLVIGGSAIATTAVINMIPKVKDWKAWQKALLQGGAGLLGLLFVRNLWVKKVASGAIAGGGMTLTIPWLKERFPDVTLFGPVNRMNNGNGMTDYQRSRLGQNSTRYSIRNYRPTNRTAGPVNAMQGPWPSNEPNMGCAGNATGTDGSKFMSVVG